MLFKYFIRTVEQFYHKYARRHVGDNKKSRRITHIPAFFVALSGSQGADFPDSSADLCDEISLREAMRDFVRGLDPIRRRIFLQRYFYMLSVREISRDVGINEGTVKTQLFRIRQSLRDYLNERGIEI